MTYEDNYLAHWGITGMKWGVRRFQNPDGSLTEEGKLRYIRKENEAKRKKKVSEMTDQELRERLNRLTLEKQYRDLVWELKQKPGSNKNNGNNNKQQKNNDQKKNAHPYLKKIFVATAATALSDVMTNVYKEHADEFMSKRKEKMEKKKSETERRKAEARAEIEKRKQRRDEIKKNKGPIDPSSYLFG